MRKIEPTGRERTFAEEDIIVSKTDVYGKITYANDVFLKVAGYTEEELIGAPHSIIRHPDMPRCVFQLAWQRIQSGKEIFAYVMNMAKSGDHYWVFAHLTPTFGPNGEITGYHSNRRVPDRAPVERVQGIYATLLAEEKKHDSKEEAMAASGAILTSVLESLGTSYDELMFALAGGDHG
jgi:PAS domain S-box-containing protein